MIDSSGPFRSDARVERRAACAPPEVAIDVVMRGAHAGRWFLLYLGVIAAGTMVTAIAVPDARSAGLATTLGVVGFAALMARSLRQRRNLTEPQRASLPLRCSFTRDEIILERQLGRARGVTTAVRVLVRSGPWLAVSLHGDSVLVLRESDDGGETLADFLTRRATGLYPKERLTRSRRRLAALAFVYVAAVIAAVMLAR